MVGRDKVNLKVDGFAIEYNASKESDLPSLPGNCYSVMLGGDSKSIPVLPDNLKSLQIVGVNNLEVIDKVPDGLQFVKIDRCPDLQDVNGKNGIMDNARLVHVANTPKLSGKGLHDTAGVAVKELRRISPEHWNHMGEAACKVIEREKGMNLIPSARKQSLKANMSDAFRSVFYRGIWENYSKDRVQYKFTDKNPKDRDEKWSSVVKVAKTFQDPPQSAHLQHGQILVQGNGVETARLVRAYKTPGSDVARIQFVAKQGAGMELYTAIGESIDDFVGKECGGDEAGLPVNSYEVFGEKAQEKRSESGVIYMNQPVDANATQSLINNYLQPGIGDRLASLPLIGMQSFHDGQFNGAALPPSELQMKLFGEDAQESHGALMRMVLAESYSRAAEDLASNGHDVTADALTERAKVHSQEVWKELGMTNAM